MTLVANPNNGGEPDVHIQPKKAIKGPVGTSSAMCASRRDQVLALLPMIVVHRGKIIDPCGPTTAREFSDRFLGWVFDPTDKLDRENGHRYMKCRLFPREDSGSNVSQNDCAVRENLPNVLQNCVGSDPGDDVPLE